MMNIMCYLGKLAYYIQMFSIMARSLFFVWFNFSGEAFIAVFGVGKKNISSATCGYAGITRLTPSSYIHIYVALWTQKRLQARTAPADFP